MTSEPTCAAKPIAYVLCELKARDFESGLLVAGELLKAGYPTVIGQWLTVATNAGSGAPLGVVLFRTCNRIQAEAMEKCREAGNIVLAMDEEALPFAGEGLLANLHPTAFENCREFFAQSEAHAATVRSVYSGSRIRITGSPRVDQLLTAPPDPMPGPYALFNTSFALTNSIWGSEQTAVEALLRAQHMPADEVRDRLEFERETMKQLVALVRWLAPQYPVVVRPHPAENPAAWETIPGIRVKVGTNPIPWIRGATVTVHANSTTGVEAALLGCATVNICPPQFKSFTAKYVVSSVNYTVAGAQEAVGPLSQYLRSKKGPIAAWRSKVKFHKHGARNIAQAIAAYLPPPAPIDELHWHNVSLPEVSRAKFTASLSEVRLPAISLSESCFLITPQTL